MTETSVIKQAEETMNSIVRDVIGKIKEEKPCFTPNDGAEKVIESIVILELLKGYKPE